MRDSVRSDKKVTGLFYRGQMEIKINSGMRKSMKIKIKGTGSAVPKLRVTNDDLSKLMDTSDEWIRSRTGIGARHLAVEETTTGLAVAAAKEALKDAEMTAEELDLIIAATVTADKFLPNLSCEVQSALGAKNAVAFDLNAACSGFLFALNTVQMYLENGVYKKALVIGAETLSKIMDWNDRSTCVLFGDGAGAAVVEVDSETNCKAKQPGAANKSGILSMVQVPTRGGKSSAVITVRSIIRLRSTIRNFPMCR